MTRIWKLRFVILLIAFDTAIPDDVAVHGSFGGMQLLGLENA